MNNLKKKFFYALGVYTFCVGIHEGELSGIFDELKSIARNVCEIVDICRKTEKGKEYEKHKEIKQQTGFTPKKVVNKIGF